MLSIENPETCTFADIKQLIGSQGSISSNFKTAIPDKAVLSSYLYEYNDFYLNTKTSQPSRHTPAKVADVMAYDSITAYSWEDRESKVVVRIPVPNGPIALSDIQCSFQERSFEVCIRGKPSLRFHCPRTHALISPEGCSFRLSKDSVVVSLAKFKSETWFDLFKKRTIGDSEAL